MLGPIARNTPTQIRYYVSDGLGHTRLLLDNQGNITDTYVYDAWGNALAGSAGNTPNPFTWNGAFGYEWIPFTGLYHVGAREYDPRTARWLQRDPVGVAGGDINLHRYCFNRPLQWKDPSGLQVVIFVHGSRGRPGVFDKSFLSAAKLTLGATGHTFYSWSGTINYNTMQVDANRFCEFVKSVKLKRPDEPVFVVAHSNGGNVSTLAASLGAPIDMIVRLGSPIPNDHQHPGYTNVPSQVKVFHFYDSRDSVVSAARAATGATSALPTGSNWCNVQVAVPGNGISLHSNFLKESVWTEMISPFLYGAGPFYNLLYDLTSPFR